MIFAYPLYEATGQHTPAEHWHWTEPTLSILQRTGVAVDGEIEDAFEWLDGPEVDRPPVHKYPITEMLPNGTLVWADIDGMRPWHIGVDSYHEFVRTVAEIGQDGDVRGSTIWTVPKHKVELILLDLISQARTLVDLPRVMEPGAWFFKIPQRPKDDEEDLTSRPTTECRCGYPLIWVEGRWQHDAAPGLWGDEHDPDADERAGPARRYWDIEDCITDDDEQSS